MKNSLCFISLSVPSSSQAVGLATCFWERSEGMDGFFPKYCCVIFPFWLGVFLAPRQALQFSEQGPIPQGSDLLSDRGIRGSKGRIEWG